MLTLPSKLFHEEKQKEETLLLSRARSGKTDANLGVIADSLMEQRFGCHLADDLLHRWQQKYRIAVANPGNNGISHSFRRCFARCPHALHAAAGGLSESLAPHGNAGLSGACVPRLSGSAFPQCLSRGCSAAHQPSRQGFLQAPDTAVDWSSKLRLGFNIAKTIRKPLDWRKYRYPFLYGQMDQTLFDLAAWRDCARRALAREDFILMAGDFAAADDVELVNYIRSRTLPSRGIHAEPDEILVTVGAQNALWIISHLLLTRRSHVVCENPGHPDISATLHLTGANVTALDVDEGGLPPELLPDEIDAVFVTPSHQSPTAATMPRARRIALLEAAAERDFVIVEDDYEFEMSFCSRRRQR